MKRIIRNSPAWKALKALYAPSRILTRLVEAAPFAPFSLKCALDAFPRPAYAYGVVNAARVARSLGIREISALEFGVGEGSGLIELEALCASVRRHLGVEVRVFGFDLGDGLPAARDYRDCPYLFKAGWFAMDRERLQNRLQTATLILGDVAETATGFLESHAPPPIGFIAFDLDYYSSTRSALEMLANADLDRFLPRTFCYFDDIVGPDEACHSEYTGELLAISEFNSASEDRKISKIHGLAHKRISACYWADQLYALHLFSHAQYCQHIEPEAR